MAESHRPLRLVFVACVVALAVAAPPVSAQDPVVQVDPADGLRIRLPTLVVEPQKEAEPAQEAPVSVTPVSAETLRASGVRSVSEAGEYAPNTFFNEFTARKLSNARFRGVGSSPQNPAVTTYIDGVPQLHANSSSLELVDVEQIEFVRGPQSALFGRNALAGVINIRSARPSLQDWRGAVESPVGNFGAGDVRVSAAGPLRDEVLGLGAAFGYSRRDGFTRNPITDQDIDSRSAAFARTQLLWTPAGDWEARVILGLERARDGDYALNDLAALRARPFEAARDVEGYTRRDVVAPTLQVRRTGAAVDLWSTTGIVRWQTDDLTDLDYSPLPLAVRRNEERSVQFTQEVRAASARDASIALAEGVTLRWQAGASVFTQGYDQEAVNDYAPFVLSPFLAFPVREHTPVARLEDRGLGVYGEVTFGLRERVDITVGARGDVERKTAELDTYFTPLIAPPAAVRAERTFSDVSPQVTAAYRLAPGRMAYATVSRGYKAGGFNPASPAGREAYGEEHSWNYEGGVKTTWLDDRVSANAAVFHLQWDDMQVNSPNPAVPAQFFIENAAGATSTGVELEFAARLAPGCDLFAGIGYADARFGDGSVSLGFPVAGNRLANAPRYTADAGGQYTVALPRGVSAYVRAELTFRGSYLYDDLNTEGQDAYSLAHFRAGVRGQRAFAEVWTRNAFDTRYVPLAFPFASPSGFLGENGAPRTFGARAGVTF